ncbi:hypothetical protein GCM10017602_01510 [Herbiconiux flava]|nr:hypothetical protein GCM10017602_01510 [Herbiconiux flava]
MTPAVALVGASPALASEVESLPTQAAAVDTAAVSGRLLSPEFPSRPAAGTHYVQLLTPGNWQGPTYSGYADSTGAFSVTGIPPGPYTMRIGANTESFNVDASGDITYYPTTVTLAAGDNLVINPQVPYESNPIQPTIERLEGSDRFETAVRISQSAYDGGVPVVYLVSGSDFADALTAAPAAATDRGPLLLTTSDSLPVTTRDELARLAPQKVVIVGGRAAVGNSVEQQVKAVLPSTPIDRLAGTDRFATSMAIAERRPGLNCSTAAIASGASFPDALSVSPLVGSFHGPLLLVPGSATALQPEAVSLLQRLGCQSVLIAGGTNAVSGGIEQSVRSVVGAGSVTRFAGSTRYDTSRLINEWSGPSGHAYFTSGENFPDALAAAAVVGAGRASMYITLRSCIPDPLRGLVNARNPALITLVGGTNVIDDTVAYSKYNPGCAALSG